MSSEAVRIADATGLAELIRSRVVSATEVATEALERIREKDPALNCFTAVFEESALQHAEAVDSLIAMGKDPGPLAGVPIGAKNLFDVAGIATAAGSRIHAERPPADKDATAVARLKGAGAVLLGVLNMDEYALGFVTENAHYGATHNPHDLDRVAGGSSGGSAAAVAARLVPVSLGTDTNGSVRVPAAFCGIFGLKPTYGRISRAGVFPLADSLDHVGPFARSVRDLGLCFDLMHDADPRESTVSTLSKGIDGLRIAVLDDPYFRQGSAEAFAPVTKAANALGVTRVVTVAEADKARAAAFIITMCEGGHLHLPDLRTRPQDFDPATVTRFMAGALLPATWYQHAQRFRAVFRERMRELFRSVDVILAPATPCPAIRIGQPTITLGGQEVPSRPNLGVFTQPFSFVGLPIVAAPIFEPGSLPLGVQIIGPAYKEESVLRVAAHLERLGIARAHAPQSLG